MLKKIAGCCLGWLAWGGALLAQPEAEMLFEDKIVTLQGDTLPCEIITHPRRFRAQADSLTPQLVARRREGQAPRTLRRRDYERWDGVYGLLVCMPDGHWKAFTSNQLRGYYKHRRRPLFSTSVFAMGWPHGGWAESHPIQFESWVLHTHQRPYVRQVFLMRRPATNHPDAACIHYTTALRQRDGDVTEVSLLFRPKHDAQPQAIWSAGRDVAHFFREEPEFWKICAAQGLARARLLISPDQKRLDRIAQLYAEWQTR